MSQPPRCSTWCGVTSAHELGGRQRLTLLTACASEPGDSYCSSMWSDRPAAAGSAHTAAADDVQVLRDAGFSDEQISAITVFVALRLAFSTVNDTLGLPPDVLDAITRGRPIDVESP